MLLHFIRVLVRIYPGWKRFQTEVIKLFYDQQKNICLSKFRYIVITFIQTIISLALEYENSFFNFFCELCVVN